MALTDLPLAAPQALRAGVEFLARLPEVEKAIGRAATRAQGALDEILGRVEPIEAELENLRKTAESLRAELEHARDDLRPLAAQMESLQTTAAHLEGALQYVMDRVPGLSSERAEERGQEVAAEADSL